jgi:hypothetical protein
MASRSRDSSSCAPRGAARGQNARFRRRAAGVLLLALLASGCALALGGEPRAARVIGATEVLRVEAAQLDFLARIDTGARTTSIHALDLEIRSPAARAEDNVGREIRFRISNERGEAAQLSSEIAGVVRVRSAQGSETRYAVPLDLSWNGVRKRVLVNLRDRSSMDYKLLVGRDWLRGGFLVDVDRNAGH